MKFSVVVLLFILNLRVNAQKIDYLEIRDSLKSFSCNPGIDSGHVHNTIRNLEGFDVKLLGKNVHHYYDDLAGAYWLLSNKDKKYLEKTIEHSMSALYHKRDDTRALNTLVYAYFQMNDCIHGVYYLSQYKKLTPKRFWKGENESMEEKYIELCGGL